MPDKPLFHRPPYLLAHCTAFIIACLLLSWLLQPDYPWIHFLIFSAVLIWVPVALNWCVAEGYLTETVLTISLPAGISYTAAAFIESTLISFVLTIPWMLLAVYGTIQLALRQRSRSFDHIIMVVAFAFWATATAWGASYQLNYRPFNFSSVIVLLTAAHFHFAGFLLTLLAAVLLHRLKYGCWAYLWSALILVAIPLTAAGILNTHLNGNQVLETIAGVAMAIGGAGIAGAFVKYGWQNRAGYLCVSGGLLLICGMILATLYALRTYFIIPWLDIPFMYHLHGSANMLGIGALAIVVFWQRKLSE